MAGTASWRWPMTAGSPASLAPHGRLVAPRRRSRCWNCSPTVGRLKFRSRLRSAASTGRCSTAASPGEPLQQVVAATEARRIASDLAHVRKALHRTPPADALRTGIPDLSGIRWGDACREICARFRGRVLPLLASTDASAGRQFLDRFLERTSDPTVADALVHRDVEPAHVLCCHGRLSGVIDWTDACIGDPAVDLAWLLHDSPRPPAGALEDALDVDADLRDRSQLYHQLGPGSRSSTASNRAATNSPRPDSVASPTG
jgi:hypothetical protein